jgi:hypothetical protein
MSRLAFDVWRLAFRHQRHFYSNEDSRRDETGGILAVANPERAFHRDPRQKGAHWRVVLQKRAPNTKLPDAKRSKSYFTSFKRSA